MLVGFIAWSVASPVSVDAAEQGYNSHGVTSFYGVYEMPPDTGTSAPDGEDSGSSSPNHSGSGNEIIPNTGEQDFSILQASGATLLLAVVPLLWIQKKKGENL